MEFVRHDLYWEMLFVWKPLLSGDRAPGGGHRGGKGLEAELRCGWGQQVDPGGWRKGVCLGRYGNHLGEVSGGQNSLAQTGEFNCDP